MKAFLQKLFALPIIGGLFRKIFAGFVAKESQDLGIATELEKDLRSQTVTSKEFNCPPMNKAPIGIQSVLPAARARGLMQGKGTQGPQN